MNLNWLIRLTVWSSLFLGIPGVQASDLKISGITDIKMLADGTAGLECEVSWSNAWRNVWNYDAVYLFAKCRIAGQSEWHHLVLADQGHVVGDGYNSWCTPEGRGLFVFPATVMNGVAGTKVRLVVRLDGNDRSVLTPALIEAGQVQVSLQGIEMVYVPTAPFYAGDGTAEASFSSPFLGTIPAAYDIIGTNSTFAYSASVNSANAVNVTGRTDKLSTPNWYGAVPCWWMVDFKVRKKILYFGVSSLWQNTTNPGSTWYLEGSDNNAAWKELWSGGPEYWGTTRISYPVQQMIKVQNPDSCRYYRIRVVDVDPARKPYGSEVYLLNVAMTEKDLGALNGDKVLVDGQTDLASTSYPSGYRGFYTMKYEVSQEQYVTFLNQLPYSAQRVRTLEAMLEGLHPGEYIYGDSRQEADNRNGIVLMYRKEGMGEPVVFGCNLNPGDSINSLADGQTIACNFLSPADAWAYADWTGLRPLTELEYEKMCRSPYPAVPRAGAYAWGDRNMLQGSSLGDAGMVTEAFAGGNANLGNANLGPVRTGSFTRAGQNRVNSGLSWWGVEDLSGNLAEIYYNAGTYGRQFTGKNGNGELTALGETDVADEEWPKLLTAVAVRGGSYASPLKEAMISDRSRVEDCFTDFNQRLADVGVRLGCNAPQEVLTSVLTLENGTTATDGFLYDTICSTASYLIRGDVSADSEAPHVFSWYRSADGGDTWELLPDVCTPGLQLDDLIDQVEFGAVREFRYKRYVTTPSASGQSATVVLTVGNGYLADRLRDTIRPCMASYTKGFTLTTPLAATFEWKGLNHQTILTPQEETAISSRYVATLKDMNAGERSELLYTLTVKITMAGKCEYHRQLQVDVLRQTETPFPDGNEGFAFGADGTYTVSHAWNGTDHWTWRLLGETGGIRIDPETGVLSGMKDTICLLTVGLVCDELPDAIWKKQLMEERVIPYTGNMQELVMIAGHYRVECWGARGGSYSGGNPGKGAYAAGDLALMKNLKMALSIGGIGGTGAVGGWNGGGAGATDADNTPSYGGGGATDIRIGGASWNNRIIVAGGGGGTADVTHGTGYFGNAGGGGGTLTGLNGAVEGNDGVSANAARGGTQIAGGIAGKCWTAYPNEAQAGSFGVGGYGIDVNNHTGGGGGGGYYGGGGSCAWYQGGGGGGSSFISGYTGCDAVDASGAHTGQPNHYSGFIFSNPQMTSGVWSNNGQIKITVK